MNRPALIASLLILAAGVAAPASAHITLAEPSALSGASYTASFRVSHGCDGSPTVALRVEIPEEVTSAKPEAKAGWSVRVETAPLAKPARPGGDAAARVIAVAWRGRLDAHQADRFDVSVKLPARSGLLYFPTVQTCESGENRWTQIPAPGAAWTSVPRPAPVLHLSSDGAGAEAKPR